MNLLNLLNRTKRHLNRHSALVVLLLATVTLVSTMCGAGLAHAELIDDWTLKSLFNWFTAALYMAAQAIFLNFDPHPSKNASWWIGIARVAAVLLVAFVAAKAIGFLFKDSFTRLKLALWRKQTILVCGLGRIGIELVEEFSKKGQLVVVIELDTKRNWTRTAEKLGAVVFEGDATDAETLSEFLEHPPQQIYVVTGNDHVNLAVLANIQAAWPTVKPHKLDTVTQCYVHIENDGLNFSLNRQLFSVTSSKRNDAYGASLIVQLFNISHETASELIIDRLTALRPQGQDEVALYFVFGAGQMGLAMIKELTLFAHFENAKRARILVLTENAKEKCDEALLRWGRLSPTWVHGSLNDLKFDGACDVWSSHSARPAPEFQVDDEKAVEYAANVHFCEFSEAAISLNETECLVRLATEANVRPVVLLCYDEDEVNFRLASELHSELQEHHGINVDLTRVQSLPGYKPERYARHSDFSLPIFVFLPRNRPLRSLLAHADEKYPMQVFGKVSEGLSRARDQVVDEIAIDIGWGYAKSVKPELTREQYIQTVWDKAPQWERNSNLFAAEHALIKIQILGYRFVRGINPNVKTYPWTNLAIIDRARLGLIEHNRWMAERLLLGWKYGPRSEQPPARDSMTSWADLPAGEVSKDFDQIQAVFQFFVQHRYSLEELE